MLQIILLSVILACNLIAGGAVTASDVSGLQDGLLHRCDLFFNGNSDFNTNEFESVINDICDNAEQLRSCMIASTVSSCNYLHNKYICYISYIHM